MSTETHIPKKQAPLLPQGDFGLLSVTGPDAKKFLQGQLTCNLEELQEQNSLLGAHCNPQGRVLFLFRLFYFLEAYYLVLPQESTSLALQALKKYTIFFKLSLHPVNELPDSLRQQAAASWSYFDLAQGIPQIYPATSGLFLPHDLNLHQLEGLSWNKGCYTGQEIIARMQYRGKLKNHLFRAEVQTSASPQLGMEIYCQNKQDWITAGRLVDYRSLDYNLYQVLVLISENYSSSLLKLDPQQNETWEWLK